MNVRSVQVENVAREVLKGSKLGANEQPIDGKKGFLERPMKVDVSRRCCMKISNVA